jgi:hypothetical protein
MKSKYDYDTIRDYLHGLVDQETARRIRDLIRTDDVARNIAAGILQLEHEFKGEEQEIEAYIEGLRDKQLQLIGAQGRVVPASRNWMRLAAAILIIVASAAVLWLTVFRNDRNDLLEAELSQRYPSAVVERGESDVDAGFEFYSRGEYAKAIASFDMASNDVSVTFYNGLSNLYAGEYTRAVALLSSNSLRTSRYAEQAVWFRSLALIKSGRNDEAKESLEEISKNSELYKSKEALQLLEEMD